MRLFLEEHKQVFKPLAKTTYKDSLWQAH
jgi:hypothetical protein